jgi:hypothetical protein
MVYERYLWLSHRASLVLPLESLLDVSSGFFYSDLVDRTDPFVALNAIMKPAAGVLEFVSLPMEGTVKSIRGMFHKEVGKERHLARYREGLVACREGSQAERDGVVAAFSEYKAKNWVSHKKGKGKAT